MDGGFQFSAPVGTFRQFALRSALALLKLLHGGS